MRYVVLRPVLGRADEHRAQGDAAEDPRQPGIPRARTPGTGGRPERRLARRAADRRRTSRRWRRGRLRLRQQPGEDNALGTGEVHVSRTATTSTCTRRRRTSSSANRVRAFSHGCIRVADPLRAGDAGASGCAEGDWTREKIAGGDERHATRVRINLARPINVLILYATALATEAGRCCSSRIIYGYDRSLERQLGLPRGALIPPRDTYQCRTRPLSRCTKSEAA